MNPILRGLLLAMLVGGLGYLAWDNDVIGRLQLIDLAVFVPSVVLHEVSHGWVALGFGDDTAKRAGRLTLNPIAHVDPFWTVALPVLLALSGAPIIGMAKPVPVSQSRMRDPRNHGMLTALAGPAVNLAIAAVAGLTLRAAGWGDVVFGVDRGLVAEVVFALGLINIILAVFNLIPLPPLDGSAVVERVLPVRLLVPYFKFRQYSFFVLIAIFLLADDLFLRVVRPFVELWRELVI